MSSCVNPILVIPAKAGIQGRDLGGANRPKTKTANEVCSLLVPTAIPSPLWGEGQDEGSRCDTLTLTLSLKGEGITHNRLFGCGRRNFHDSIRRQE